MGEFELIRTLFRPLAEATWQEGVVLGPGDDCAVQRIPVGEELVFSIDTLVEGVHFPAGYDASRLGWRALAVAVSDLAPMGATPVCYTLALTLPEANEPWVRSLTAGLLEASQCFGIALAGGDITRGPLTLTIQVHGTAPEGAAIRRSGAVPGDLIAVSGSLGGAAAALRWLEDPSPAEAESHLLRRYHRPVPRVALGQSLRGLASSAIDVSDGLVADLQHILLASGVGARLELAKVPLAGAIPPLTPHDMLEHALYGGDDYELCITLSPRAWGQLSPPVVRSLTVIGEVVEGHGLVLVDVDGAELSVRTTAGYDHFHGELVGTRGEPGSNAN